VVEERATVAPTIIPIALTIICFESLDIGRENITSIIPRNVIRVKKRFLMKVSPLKTKDFLKRYWSSRITSNVNITITIVE
jgi:hypothetical protein